MWGGLLNGGGRGVPLHCAAIVRLLRELDSQARLQGGAVYMLNGNHESLNISGHFRQVGCTGPVLCCLLVSVSASPGGGLHMTPCAGWVGVQVCHTWGVRGVCVLRWPD